MKILFVSLLFISTLFSSEYYSKLEPIESYKIKSSVSGKVIFSNNKIEGKRANNSTIIEIDSKVNRVDLKQSQNKLNYLNQMIEIENNNYKRLTQVSSRSMFEKDTQKTKVINLLSSKADMLIKIENLKDTISNKKLVEKSNYIYSIYVKEGDYVNPGTLLYETKDMSKGKLEFFIPIGKINDIKNKTIFIDGKKSNLKVSKLYKVADSSHISSYKVQLVIDKVKTFSRLVKIEFK